MEPQRQDDEDLLTVAAVAAYLGLTAKRLREMIRDREAPRPIHLGKSIRWRRGTIRRWVAAVETFQELDLKAVDLRTSMVDSRTSASETEKPASGRGKPG